MHNLQNIKLTKAQLFYYSVLCEGDLKLG